MKKSIAIIGLAVAALGFTTTIAFAQTAMKTETMVFDSTNNYIGACSYTDASEWTLTQDLAISKFQLWYKWQTEETSLPVTVNKDGAVFATFEATRGACDPYQSTWCNADYTISKTFPAGTYTTKIPTAYQCLKPGGTGTVRLYSATRAAATTNVNGSATNDNTNTNLIAPSPSANANLNANGNANVTTARNANVNTNATKEAAEKTSNTTWYIIIGILVITILVLLVMVFTCRKNKITPPQQ
jgi:hypothetical protein